VCQSAVHLFKIPVFMSLGFDFEREIPFLTTMIVAVVCGSFLGKWLLSRISQALFVRAFETILCVIAIYLIVKALLPYS
jgi:uncharacterized membrane protein YfcA